MADPLDRGPVVVATDVYSARLIPNSTLARQYEPLLLGRIEFVSFQTVAEVRYGALLRGWGTARARWIAATAIRLGAPLVSNDRVFEKTPGLRLEAAGL